MAADKGMYVARRVPTTELKRVRTLIEQALQLVEESADAPEAARHLRAALDKIDSELAR